ncbi:MAG: glutamine--fructose-6-phosphate transaminase (isomerizing), partial [Oscillospiraceae bacterium]|nr:glutamine--fructose-6-phosphate transaminase (isomerizing) [Oscillospiraceae bacterium]
MIKEIEEQPHAIVETLMPRVKDGRIDISEMKLTDDDIKNAKKLTIVACGTASHAAYVGKYVFEKLLRLPVDVDIASEFRYRQPIFEKDQLMLVISQSGETADTIAAMREAQKNGIKVMSIVNVPGSTIARDADAVFYTRAGVEIAVASTKAYLTQLLALFMLVLELGRIRGSINDKDYEYYLSELMAMPERAEKILESKTQIQKFAAERFMERSTFFIGRGLDYALAMESSLKLKEVSYVHSEAYAAGELKHGTIALIEEDTLVVALCTQSALLDKTISNIKEVKARQAYVMAVAQESCPGLDNKDVADITIRIPDCCDLFAPMLAVIPMQLFAYYVSVQKGCDVDKPRNLAKSVTVE